MTRSASRAVQGDSAVVPAAGSAVAARDAEECEVVDGGDARDRGAAGRVEVHTVVDVRAGLADCASKPGELPGCPGGGGPARYRARGQPGGRPRSCHDEFDTGPVRQRGRQLQRVNAGARGPCGQR